jgi:hypothetical protein
MNGNDTSTVIMIADRFGVPLVVLLLVAFGVYKAAPRVAAFLTALTDELKSMTRAIGTMTERHTEHHSVTVIKIDSIGAHVDARMEAMEARVKEHHQALTSALGREVRDSVDRTGQQVAMSVHEAIEIVGRQPTNPDLSAVNFDRQTPTPAPVVRQLPPRPPSQPGGREHSRPSWEYPRKQ